ncbi:IclR family transcriptional regulator [Paenarthrobacter sp. Z7-10]|uniref:IclR family transcriptional regulator n=1 Tax=Paenarthrobacter sp. Z7-10 TaxID=2787635 RepID=UPI0022A9AB5D|nr:IclR family transcriptional regulator [Paenarthrobacter sp. Z7-10]
MTVLDEPLPELEAMPTAEMTPGWSADKSGEKGDAGRKLSAGIKPLLVLGKIRGILDAFSLTRPALTLSEIRTATGYPTSTVQRLVANLVAEEFLDREGDKFRIGVNFAYWAAPATRGLDELDVIRPVLNALRDTTGETTSIFRLEGNRRVCVAMAETRHSLRREMHVGKIMAAHAGSAGKVLLAWNPAVANAAMAATLERLTEHTITDPARLRAELDQTRREGYSVTSDERDEGATGIAAPIFNSMGDLMGALSVSGPSFRVTDAKWHEWIDPLAAAAEQATRLIGGRLPN